MHRRILMRAGIAACACIAWLAPLAIAAESVDVLIRDGVLYDGSGAAPVRGDVAIRDGRVVASGRLSDYSGRQEVNARGLAVAPGFINMLSWATESLIHDGRGMSDIKQGRHPRGVRRRQFVGSGERADPRGDAEDAGRHPL